MKREKIAIAAIILVVLLISIFFIFTPQVVSAYSPPTPEVFEQWTTCTYGDAAQLTNDGRFMAQEFCPRAGSTDTDGSFYITGVRLKMYRAGSPGDIVVAIYDTDGVVSIYGAGANALCSVEFDADTMTASTSGAWYWFNFTQFGGEPLSFFSRYFIVVTSDDADSSNHVHWMSDRGFLGTAPYPGGGDNTYEIHTGDLGGVPEGDTLQENTFCFQCYGIGAYSTEDPQLLKMNYYGTDGMHDDSDYAADATNIVAQSFTPSEDYYIIGAEFLGCDQGTGTVTVSLYNNSAGSPAASAWTSGSFNVDLLEPTTLHDMFAKGTFTKTCLLLTGTTYWLVINGPAVGDVYVRYDAGGGYSGAMKTSSNAGASWSSTSSDFLFRTYGMTSIVPTNPSITANVSVTTSRAVNLTVSCDDATTMQFRNETSAWSTNQSYSTWKHWNLSAGYGQKNVTVRFWNTNGSATDYVLIAYVDTLMEVTDPSPANQTTDVSLTPHMNVTLANHSTNTRLRVFVSRYWTMVPSYWMFWTNISSVTTSTDGVKWFNITVPLNADTQYAWFVEVTNTTSGATYYFPSSGYLLTPGTSYFGFDTPHYCWFFNTTATMMNITFENPVDDHSYTTEAWLQGSNRTLIVNVSDNTLQHNVSLYMTVKVRLVSGGPFITMDEVRITPDPTIAPGIEGLFYYDDFSTYVPYGNAEYNITVKGYDWDLHGSTIDNDTYRASISPNGNGTMNFTLGTIGPKKGHFAIRSCEPANGDENGIDAVTAGFTCQVAVNTTAALPEFWMFVCDEEGNVLTYGSRTSTDQCFQNYTLGLGEFEPREHYYILIGFYWSGSAPGDTLDWGVLPLTTTQTDDFYDDTAYLIGNFTYEWKNTYVPKIFRIYGGTGADAEFYGYRIGFYTYPAGEHPAGEDEHDGADMSTGSDWGADALGPYAGFAIIAGLILMAVFIIMPYVIIKKRAKNVPLPVLTTFALFGAIFAYVVGFFPLWFFIVPTFLCIIILTYKAINWVMSDKGVTNEGGTP